MRRTLGTLFSAGLILLAVGCGKRYEQRVEATLTHMRYLERLDQFLQPAVGDPLQPLGIYLRPPKPLTRAQQPGLVPDDPAQFDVNLSFLDLTAAPSKGAGGAAVLRLHVLGRVKRTRPPAKKGEPPPPEVVREAFPNAVLALLARDLGGIEPEVAVAQLKADKKRSNEYKRLIFSAANSNIVRAYLQSQGDYDVALVWDIPPSQEKSSVVTTGIELTLESLKVGPRAMAAFQGVDVDDENYLPGGPAGGESAPGGVAF